MNRFSFFISILLITCLYGHTQNIWQQTDFIWSAGIEIIADVGLKGDPREFFQNPIKFSPEIYQNINSGDIVWLPCRYVQIFAKEILPSLSNPFILLINDARDGDHSFPSDCPQEFNLAEFVNNPLILHIFAQNCDYQGNSKKISHFPIGIDFHTISYKGENGGWGEIGSPLEQEHVLKDIISQSKPTNERKKLAFVDFHHSDTMHASFKRYLQFGEDRKSIFATLLPTGLIDHCGWMKRYSLWEKKAEYAFSISPHGNGLDCHRTWEDLALGCIVIVKTSPLDPLYEGLPVVIIKEWSEITKENMDKWLELYGNALHNPSYREKLTHNYWYNKLLQMRKYEISL